MIADLKKAPKEVKDWFRKTEEKTGMDKTAIITGIVMSFILKSKQPQPRNPEPKKPAV